MIDLFHGMDMWVKILLHATCGGEKLLMWNLGGTPTPSVRGKQAAVQYIASRTLENAQYRDTDINENGIFKCNSF